MDKGLVNIINIVSEEIGKEYGEDSVEHKCFDIFMEAFKLFVRKQHDYGPTNIGVTGLKGIIVRVADKVSRLVNLFNKDSLGEAQNESIEDTLLDMVNYSAMGLMDFRGQWPRFEPTEAWKIEGEKE